MQRSRADDLNRGIDVVHCMVGPGSSMLATQTSAASTGQLCTQRPKDRSEALVLQLSRLEHMAQFLHIDVLSGNSAPLLAFKSFCCVQSSVITAYIMQDQYESSLSTNEGAEESGPLQG